MEIKKIRVSIIGLGYIGLPTAALLAKKGYRVAGIEKNQELVNLVNEGKTHVAEPDLGICVKSMVSKGYLKAFKKPQVAEVYIICVPTPVYETSLIPTPNMDFVLDATRSIAKLLKPNDLLILESTSPVGTTEKIRKFLIDQRVDVDQIDFAYCPERVLPGKILTELIENDRIVGGLTSKATANAKAFYETFVSGNIFGTDAKTAEMCKLTENSFRDINIAFANELSMICKGEEIDVWELIKLANRHPRVNILEPGPGVGGHCIAVDPWFIVSRNPDTSKLIRSAREVNNLKTDWVVGQIRSAAEDLKLKTGNSPKILCLGLTFKPDVDDLRGSPALSIVECLLKHDFKVEAVEPNVSIHPGINIKNIETEVEKETIVVMLVKHKEFVDKKFLNKLRSHNVLDYCGLFHTS
tara:strand:- start:7010 stop:8242 length:1233 start_codon:yes stop_codon:yes gene_type:complete